jgi:hypothetical protein
MGQRLGSANTVEPNPDLMTGEDMNVRRLLGVVLAAVVLTGFGPVLGANAAAGPVITNPATTYLRVNQQFTVKGTAKPGAVVVLHYHKAGTASSDYSIVRSVRAASSGAWSRASILNVDYRVFATVGIGNPHSKTVLFTAATPPPRPPNPTTLGGVQNVLAEFGTTTIGVQFATINGAASSSLPPDPGNRYVAVKACVRNRGPLALDDSAGNDFALSTSAGFSYDPIFWGVSDGPDLDLSNVAVNELRCGYVSFELPINSDVTQLRFTSDSGFGSTIRWATP